ncbi:MAG TPA: DNA gyrase subunit B, partial [Kofleriaceae bacterium]
EKGHVFIAQPPLYKVKKGKTELYLKNEGALAEHLLDSMTKEHSLEIGNNQKITGEEFATLVTRINTARDLRQQLDKKTDKRISAEFANAGLLEADMSDRDKLERVEAKVMAEVARRHGELGQAVPEYKQDTEHGTWELRFGAGQHGVRRHTTINSELVRSSEFKQLREISAELKTKLIEPVKLISTEKDVGPVDIQGWDEIATLIEERGRKGLQIQRYKGLGEMNAEQLWETTMDPTARTLLRVKIEEMEEADGIFTKLMGDLVEPRREFIEENALNVRNLDI